MNLACDICGFEFVCNKFTARIKGPIINVGCPKCGFVLKQNMSAFVERPFDKDDVSILQKARDMIDLAQEITLEVGEDTAFLKRKR